MDHQLDLAELQHSRLLDGFSLEATLPSQGEIAAAREMVEPGTRVYLSAPPTMSASKLVQLALEVRSCGLEPVPHIVARTYSDRRSLDYVLTRFSAEAGVRRALVVAGDRAEPAGPFADALAVVESDLLQRYGIADIGISAYPEGHPRISNQSLDAALNDKIAAAARRGLTVHIVTQFGFDPGRIVAWLHRLRLTQCDVPVRVGLAGPTKMRTLARYALRCGVRTSVKGILGPGTRQLLAGVTTPDDLIGSLTTQLAQLKLRDIQLHFFSFGGLIETARWASTAASPALLE